MRLIDADALLRNTVYNTLSAPYITKRDVEEAPTVDAVPVVHGRWIVDEMADGHPVWVCSVCGEEDCYAFTWGEVKRQDDLYCPKCGAQMDGGGNDG